MWYLTSLHTNSLNKKKIFPLLTYLKSSCGIRYSVYSEDNG